MLQQNVTFTLMPALKLKVLPRTWKSSQNATSKPVAKRKIKEEQKGEEDEEELPIELEVEFNFRPYHGVPKTHYVSPGISSRSK
jgi:hypothetical protein